MKKIFCNTEGRLRAGWRIVFQFVLFFFLLALVQPVQNAAEKNHNGLQFALGSLIYLVGAGLMFWFLARRVDRRRLTDYGLHLGRAWWLDLGVGFAIGVLTLSVVAGVEIAMGWAKFSFNPTSIFDGPFVLVGLLILFDMIAVGVGESLTFQAYQVINLAEGLHGWLGSRRAVAVSLFLASLIFALAHMSNPNSGLMSFINIILAGIMLGAGLIFGGELAIPLGLHISWGFFEGFVYGYPNSGLVPANTLLTNGVSGPPLWTGGAFGPEAGLLATGMIIADFLLIVAWLRLRKRWSGVCGELAEYKAA